MINFNRSVEALDRKYNYVILFQDRHFLLGVEDFIDHVNNDEVLSIYVQRLQRRISIRLANFNDIRKQLLMDLQILRDQLTKVAPQEDDSNTPLPASVDEAMSSGYGYTLAAFDSTIQHAENMIPESIDTFSSSHHIVELSNALKYKIDKLSKDEAHEQLFLQWVYISDRNSHLMYNARNYSEVAPEMALSHLLQAIKAVNPEPEQFSSGSCQLTVHSETSVFNRCER